MNKPIRNATFAVLLLCFSSSYAEPNLVSKLNKIDFQIDRAHIFAVNCAVEIQTSELTPANCTKATELIKELNLKLDRVAGLNVNKNDEITQNIKLLRIKIAQIHAQLSNATLATDDDESAAYIIDPSETSN